MESAIELQRRLYEEIDQLEQVMVDVLNEENSTTRRAKLKQEHYINALLNRIKDTSARLQTLYSDADGIRASVISQITLVPSSSGGEYDPSPFYTQLKSIRDHHRRLPVEAPIDHIEFTSLCRSAEVSDEALDALFSGEEALGRYLDLHESYEKYINLKDITRVDYLKYLGIFGTLASIPGSVKSSGQYYEYLGDLVSYLEGWFQRAMPLFNLQALKNSVAEAVASKLTTLNLYCSACKRPFTNEAVFKSHLTGKRHLRAVQAEKDDTQESTSKYKDILFQEELLSAYIQVLDPVIQETKANVERKLSRTLAEREEDIEQVQADLEALSEGPETQSDGRIYNPLNLPLDWDGKPIPYWLWKLHGLGVSYPCELCGNYIYKGRKAFDLHFNEWRHVYGLKSLGIPNTKHFFQITRIQDAIDLWDKIKQQTRVEAFRPEAMEECEDQFGNVYNRKTYEDLRRQGLL